MIRILVCAAFSALVLAACSGSASEVVVEQTDSQPSASNGDGDGDDVLATDTEAGELAIGAPISTEPPPTFLPPEAAAVANGLGSVTYDLPACPDSPRGAVTDKADQRYWLCLDGVAVTDEIPMTTASGNYGLPPVGTYEVFARDENAFGIGGEALERFVAFYTTPKGNRIAFHEVVNQDPDTVGDLDQRGASAGCFRVREADSVQVWEFLQIGDPVVVLTN